MGLTDVVKVNHKLFRFIYYCRWLFRRIIGNLLGDRNYVKWSYKNRMGTRLNLDPPVTFNEKIQWLKLFWRDGLAARCADKYAVRDYVKERIGDEFLVKLYGVFSRVRDIDLTRLPDQFVLKPTHGSAQNVFCKDKRTHNWKESFKDLDFALKLNYYYLVREWAYKDIVPGIVCEEYLEEAGAPPKDYKIFCFNGVPRFVQVDIDRFTRHARNFYSMNWELLEFALGYSRFEGPIESPKHFNHMAELAGALSRGIPFVRVDFYHVNDRVFFGEMTFYPENGVDQFNPKQYDAVIGQYLSLPKAQ
jgi:hypothetical protein